MKATFFKDYDRIPVDHRAAVNACVEHRLLDGKATGEFAPDENITLGQLCKIIFTVVNLGKELSNPDDNGEHLGSRELCHWASSYIGWCRKNGLYCKDGDTTSPNEPATYGDVYAMCTRAYRYLVKDRNDFSPQKSHPSDMEITRSGVAKELYFLCQALGDWYLNNVSDLYYIPSPEDQDTLFFFITFLPATRYKYYKKLPASSERSDSPKYSYILYVYNTAFQIDPEINASDIPLETAYALLKHKAEFFPCIQKKGVYHFTKLSTLVALASPGTYFRMSNAAFLNDPSEGQIIMNNLPARLKKLREKIDPGLKKWLKNIKVGTSKEIFNSNNTYIASFTVSKDQSMRNLPMWNTYADFCRGCAIRFTSESFRCDLYRVQYGSKKAKRFLDSFIQKLNEVWSDWGNDSSPKTRILRTIALDTLAQCSYLFKDNSYRYENEVRAIFSCPPQQAEKEKSLRDGEVFPRTYCELPFHIEHVIFGPTVAEPEQLAVGIASMGLDCTFEKSDIPFKNT